MNIAFIGYGSMAKSLAGKLATNHELFFGGHNPEKAKALADQHGVGSGDTKAAVAFGDVVFIATPHGAVFDAIDDAGGPDAFAGKTVVDINNPVPGFADRDFTLRTYDGKSLCEAIAEKLPDAHVVKAFNHCQADVWAMDPVEFGGTKLVVMYAAPDEAIDTAETLIRDVGCDPIRAGGVEYGGQLEALAAMTIKLLFSGYDSLTAFQLHYRKS